MNSKTLILIFKFKNILITFLFAVSYSYTSAQSTVLTSASPGWNLLASDAKGDFDTLKLPLKRAGNLLIVEASVDGIRGNFILDTGAPGLILNTTYFREKAIRKNRTSVGIAGTTTGVYEMEVNKLQISNLYYEKILVELTELSHIENSKNIQIYGLLGTALFEELEMYIDIRRSTLTLVKPSKNVTPKRNADVNTLLSVSNNALIIPLKVNGKILNTCFDTGAEMLVLDPLLPNKILNDVQLTKRLNVTGTGGQKTEVWSGTLKSLQFGKLEIKNTEVLITNLQQLSEVYGQPIDAIIGFALLDKGIIYINMRKNQFAMYLYKEDENE